MIVSGCNYINSYINNSNKCVGDAIPGTSSNNRSSIKEDDLKPQFCNLTSSLYKMPTISTNGHSLNNFNTFYKRSISENVNSPSPTLSTSCNEKIQSQQSQYPPQPSSTGSVSPSSSLSASISPTIFPSPSSYSSVPSSQNDIGSSYTWNAYPGLPSRPQYPYPQYAPEYYGNMSMSASAAAAGAWFSHQDRLYQPWSTTSANSYGFNFEDIAFQTQLQRRSVRCTCPNCTNEMSGLPPIVGPDERGRKQHICHIPGCERLYGKASHLKTHLRWHTGERPFLCLTCGKRFSRSDELQRHGRTHTNYRPYSCPICSKKFSRSDHLSKHKKTHFKDKKSKKGETKENVKKEQSEIKMPSENREEQHKITSQLQAHSHANESINVAPSDMSTLKTEQNSPTNKIPHSDNGCASYNLYQATPIFSQSHHHQSMGLFYNRSSETTQLPSVASCHTAFDQINSKHSSSVIGYNQQSPVNTTSLHHSYVNVQQDQTHHHHHLTGPASQHFEPVNQLVHTGYPSTCNQYSDVPNNSMIPTTSNYHNHSSHHHAWTNYHPVSQRS